MVTGVPTAAPNQFFVSTTTAQMAAPGVPIPQAQQLQAAMMQQVAANANANASVPFLIADPNMYIRAVQQQNAQMQQNARQMTFPTMMPMMPAGAPNVQMQQTPVMQQFPVLPQQVNVPAPQVTMVPQPVAAPSPIAQQTPNPPVQAQVVQQAPSKDAQLQTAGYAMLNPMQSHDVVKNQQQQVPPVLLEQQQQVTLKTVEAGDGTNSSVVPNQVFLESCLEPVKRVEEQEQEVNSDQAAEEEMWKFFFKSDEDVSSYNWNSEGAAASSVSSSDMNPPEVPRESSPALQPTSVASSNQQALAPPPTLSLQEPKALSALQPTPITSANQQVPAPPPMLSLQEPTPVKKEGSPKIVPARAECGKVKKPLQSKQRAPITFEFKGSPQDYLMAILRERGYPSERVPNGQTGYQSKSTPMELASFGTEVVKAAHSGDVVKLKTLLDCGLSPSPCNAFGDYIVHLVCRKANFGVLQCLVDHGCNLEVCDSFGRTPLHCVAWAGEFCKESAQLILDSSTNQILVEDNRGQCPLEYVRKEQWPEWIDFLRTKMDTYWPIDGKPVLPPSKETKREGAAVLSLELARAVASGSMSPEEVAAMDEATRMYYKAESLQSILFS